MIKEFVDRFMSKKPELEAIFSKKHPEDYKEIVANVINILKNGDVYDCPSSDNIHEIDEGDYQGTLVFVMSEGGYQPSDYWFVKVGYGSCSGCDTLEAIRDCSDELPTDEQIKDYMALALHIVQKLKKMDNGTVEIESNV